MVRHGVAVEVDLGGGVAESGGDDEPDGADESGGVDEPVAVPVPISDDDDGGPRSVTAGAIRLEPRQAVFKLAQDPRVEVGFFWHACASSAHRVVHRLSCQVQTAWSAPGAVRQLLGTPAYLAERGVRRRRGFG